MDVLYGLHPVEEAVRARSALLDHVVVSKDRRDSKLESLIQQCTAAKIRVSLQPKAELTRLANTDMHQGVVALLRERKLADFEDLLSPGKGLASRLLVALDGVEDPHNLGALIRSCDGAGATGLILTERRSAPLSGVVAKSSAGAIEHVRMARVTNLVRSLEAAKQHGFWVVGLDERGAQAYTEFDWRGDCVLVLGREGAGMHDLTKRTCDHLVRIPMAGHVASLNVSVAGAVVLFEAMRQRRSNQSGESAATRSPKAQRGLGS